MFKFEEYYTWSIIVAGEFHGIFMWLELFFITELKDVICHCKERGTVNVYYSFDKKINYFCIYNKSAKYCVIFLLFTFPSAWRGTEIYLKKAEGIHVSWFSWFMNKNVLYFRPKDLDKTNVFAFFLMPSLTLSTLSSKKWFMSSGWDLLETFTLMVKVQREGLRVMEMKNIYHEKCVRGQWNLVIVLFGTSVLIWDVWLEE